MEHLNRNKLFEVFQTGRDALIYIKGGKAAHRYDTDFEYAFRQESNFLYLTGIHEPDFHAVLDLYDTSYTLVIPRRDSKYAVWMGYVKPSEHYSETFRPDRVIYDDQMDEYLIRRNPGLVYVLGQDEAEYAESAGLKTDTKTLGEALSYCRCIKTEAEIEKMRKASKIASDAHVACMKAAKPGMHEYELKAVFEHHNLNNGLLHQPYNGIFAGGKNGAILHYVENNRPIPDGSLVLIDAGSEFEGYAADITRVFPISGKFTGIQADLYDTVLNALNECVAGVSPGVKMEDLHLHASKIILEGLKSCGIVDGNVQDMLDQNIFALFFPHGLGHFLGLDTHDVGGYPKGVERIDRPGLRFLRARRTLEKGMVVTIEPGVYFIPALLGPALQDRNQKRYLNADKINGLMEFGGIRIEDNIVITETGHENLTKAPKSRKDIEALMS